MTTLEPGQRGAGRTRKRWLFLALAVGSALAVLVVGTLFGVLESAPTVVPPTVHSPPQHPTASAPAVAAPPVVRAPPAPNADGQPRQVTRPDGTTTTVTVSSDGTVTNSTTTTAAPN